MQDTVAVNTEIRILIVDDELPVRKMLVRALSREDMVIDAAADAAEAIAIADDRLPDLIVADVFLNNSSGLDLVDHFSDVPAVVISGYGKPSGMSAVNRHRPIAFMAKPVDIPHLRETIRNAVTRYRGRPVPSAPNGGDAQYRVALAGRCRFLARRLRTDRIVMEYQQHLIGARNDRDIFAGFFELFVRHFGSVGGVALICDADAALQIVGRFGVPRPDTPSFCRGLAGPLMDLLVAEPCMRIVDPLGTNALFDPRIRRFLPGLTVLMIPLMPAPGELLGAIMLYKRGEQPFTGEEVSLSGRLAAPAATAVMAS